MQRRRVMRARFSLGWVLWLMMLGLLLGILPQGGYAASSPQAADEGQQLFEEKCVACHTVGQGALVGPDLQGVTERRDRDWLQRWITAPDEMLAEGDPTATELLKEYNNVPMPNLGLTEPQVAALIAYLEAAGTGAVQGSQQGSQITSGAQVGATQGEPALGKNLFTGADGFANGGPPCMACHSASGIGALGGGALGPDLTGAFGKYGGAAGLDAFISGVPTGTMNAVWADKPLTPEERANLVAFLQEAAVGQRPAQAVWQLTGLAVAGLVTLLAGGHLIWRRRLTEVRRPMVAGLTRYSSHTHGGH